MTLINAEKITKSFGSNLILKDVSFKIDEGESIGLVGANGAGKTTLFRILLGEYSADEGTVVKSKNCSLGYMQQHIVNNESVSAYESVAQLFTGLFQMEDELDEIAEEISSGNQSEELIARQHELTEKFQNQGGLTFKNRIKSTLIGLGIEEQQFSQSTSSMSGGERSKLGLARLLLSNAEILLLDEPTNHLDIKAIQWLEDFLTGFNRAYIVISHDRYFLDKVTKKTFEIENNKLKVYNAPYTQYLELKKVQDEIEQKHYEDAMQQVERMENSIEKLRSFNREKSIKRAESKIKALEKFESTIEAPEKKEGTIHFSFKCKNPGPTEILSAEKLSVGFNGQRLYENADINIRRGEKVFLLGANGCGKTTMLKQLIAGYSNPDDRSKGKIKYGIGVKCGYYDQTLSDLTLSKTVLDEVWDTRTDLTETSVRNALAAFLFKGDDVFKKIESLSGGERARVSLLKLMLSDVNLLFLDEPTNHLDIGSREALERAITDYNGSIFVVSHDRYFINKLADKLYYLDESGAKEFIGGYDDFNSAIDRINNAGTCEKEKKVSANAIEYKEKKKYESDLRKLRTALSKCEEKIENNSKEIESTEKLLQDDAVVSDYEKITDLTVKLESLRTEESALQEEWIEISIKIDEMTKE